MSTADRYRMLRSGYYRRVEIGAVAALGLHVILFALAPPYVPRPFRLEADRPLRLVETGIASAGSAVVPAPAPEARPVPAPAVAAVPSEQLDVAPPRASSAGAGAAGPGPGVGSGAGADGDAPPVFYAYDTAPRVTRRVTPEYPMMARAAGIEGTVIINVNIDDSGRLLRAWVAQSSAGEVLVSAALDAIYQFEFLPGKQGDYPVKCTVAVPFHFSLKRTQ